MENENGNGKIVALIDGSAPKAEDARKEALKKASPAEQLIVQARSALVTRICEHNGWDEDNLHSAQVAYIKAHPDWISPRIVKTTDGDAMNSVVISEDWKNAVQSVIDSTESNSPVDGLLASITQFDPNESDKLFAELTYAGLAGVPVIFTPIESAEMSELQDAEQIAPSTPVVEEPDAEAVLVDGLDLLVKIAAREQKNACVESVRSRPLRTLTENSVQNTPCPDVEKILAEWRQLLGEKRK